MTWGGGGESWTCSAESGRHATPPHFVHVSRLKPTWTEDGGAPAPAVTILGPGHACITNKMFDRFSLLSKKNQKDDGPYVRFHPKVRVRRMDPTGLPEQS